MRRLYTMRNLIKEKKPRIRKVGCILGKLIGILACLALCSTSSPYPGTVTASTIEYWAVIVGISDYVGTENDLRYCDDDAIDVYKALLSYDNWSSSHIQLLVDANATKANIQSAIGTMSSNADSNDVCFFFFAGHGTNGPDVSPLDEADGLDEYLIAQDMSLIRDDELSDWLGALPTVNRMVAIDACYSGGQVKAPVPEGRRVRTIPGCYVSSKGDGFTKDLVALVRTQDLGDMGGVALTSSDDDELSAEYSSLQNGLFTYYVVEGMLGGADTNGNSEISGEELYYYAAPRVTAYNPSQHPQMSDNYEGELALAFAPAPPPPYPDNASFVSDVTIPDGTVLSPSQSFTKIWRMHNSGTSTWGGGYELVFVGGNQMGAPGSVGLPRSVAPGEEVDISVNMVAPSAGGSYQGDWRMRNAQSVYFGDRIWVKITVPAGPTPTPPPNGGTGDIEVQSVEYPSVVTPGQSFRPRVTVKVNQGQLLQSRGDLLRNTDGNLYGAWPHVAVVGTVNAGQTYTFEFYENDPITAPSGEGTYESKWRVWRNGNWAGPEVNIRFDVRSGGGTRPDPPTLVSPGNWYVSRDGSTPTLCASAPAGLQYYFQIYESHDIPESGWISSDCWTPPSLGPYGYQWHVKVRGPGTGLESDWSETWHFSIDSQEISIRGIYFDPGSPSASEEVGVWACVEGFGGIGNDIKVYANTAADGSASGDWQWIDPVPGGVCSLDENDPSKWPKWHTRALSDGTHLIRATGWHGTVAEGNYQEVVKEATYTLLRRRPSNVQLINPGQNAWLNTRTITFRWNPEESLRVNNFAFHVSTNSDPVVNPIVAQTFNASIREYTYTFDQDYPSLYWGVQACNELGCGDRAIGHFGIDRTTPSSTVNPLNPVTFETVFQVGWTGGTDNASGIRWYDVQYRDGDRGTWVDWQTNVSSTVAIFNGQPGHKYYFHTRALDNAGNLEDYPAGNGDTFTTVNPAAAPQTPWWNIAYAYKRNILISNNVGNTMVAGYPVRLYFDSGTAPTAAELYASSQSGTKGDDFRIIYNNATELSRWVQTFSSSRIDIWFKTQANIAGNASNGTDYQLYYGNPSATNPPANIDDVMPPGKDANTLGLWHFYEGAGTTVADTSGAGRHATILTQTGSNWQWELDGKFDGYVRFFNQPQDGNGAWAEVSNGSGLSPSQLTVEAWVRMDSQPAEALIVSKRYSGDQPAWGLLLLGARPACEFNYARTQGYSHDLVLGRWEHVACTYDGSTLRVYQNGILTRQDSASKSPLVDSSPLRIGKGSNNSQFFWGGVQHMRVSNIARTDFSYAANLAAITTAPSLAVGDSILPPITGLPDLAVLSLTTYPDSSGGTLVQAVVQNQGNLGTQNGFYIDLYADHQPTGPGDYTGSIRYWVASPIEAGTTVTLTTLVTDTGQVALAFVAARMVTLSEVTSTLYVQADSTGVISETHKADNISPGTEVCFTTADAYEGNDTAETAKPIIVGQTQPHNVHGPGDHDWVKFDAQGGVAYTLYTFDLGPSADTYLYLYDMDRTTLLAFNDDYSGTLASQMEWLAPTTGTYYLLVQHWNPNVGGCGTAYSLEVTQQTLTPTPTATSTPTATPTPTNTPTPSSEAPPVAYWQMEEGAGTTVLDASGNGRTLTLAGDPSRPLWSTEVPTTTFGNSHSLLFDGVDDYADAGDNAAFDFATGFTIEAWVKAAITQNSVDSAIVSKIGECCDYQGWMLHLGSGLEGYINGGGRAYTLTNIKDNTWYHVAMTWDGVTVRIYIDGQLKASGAYALAPNSAGQPLRVGEYRYGNRNFTGNVDEVHLYNYARSVEQIRVDAGLVPGPTATPTPTNTPTGTAMHTPTPTDTPTSTPTPTDTPIFEVEIPLQIGWNHISLPVDPVTSYTAEGVCDEINSQGGNVAEIDRWYASGWDGHICGLPFNDFAIELGSDYFIKSNTVSTWTIEGYEVTTPISLGLDIGWNSIGIPHTNAYTAQSLCDEINDQCGADTAVEVDRWYASGWDGHVCGLPFNDFAIEIGKGYFVKASGVCTVTPSLAGTLEWDADAASLTRRFSQIKS